MKRSLPREPRRCEHDRANGRDPEDDAVASGALGEGANHRREHEQHNVPLRIEHSHGGTA